MNIKYLKLRFHFKFQIENLLLLLIILLYFLVRFGFGGLQSIEFGYDQPRLATVVQEYLRHGNIISAQEFALPSPWGNFSWGPVLIWFYVPFILLTTNPLWASILITVFNSLSIVMVYLIGKHFFTRRVGLIAAFLLALTPWWMIFSRMVYQPTPVPTFVTLCLYLTFLVIEHKKKWAIAMLIVLWGVLLQLYLICISIIASSGIISLIKLNRLSKKSIAAGVFMVALLFVPSVLYYTNHQDNFQNFFTSNTRFESRDTTLTERVGDSFNHSIASFIGGNFEIQLGYGYQTFITLHPNFEDGVKVLSIFAVAVLTFAVFAPFSSIYKHKRLYMLTLLGFTAAPFWFLILTKIPILPRYYLIALPSFCILVSLFIDHAVKVSKLAFIIPLLLGLWWLSFAISYHSFILNFNYPDGFLSHYSDIPYSFLTRSFDYLKNDAVKRGYKEFTVSNDPEITDSFSLNWASMYYVRYVAHINEDPQSNLTAHYVMLYSNEIPVTTKEKLAQFGPYTIYK